MVLRTDKEVSPAYNVSAVLAGYTDVVLLRFALWPAARSSLNKGCTGLLERVLVVGQDREPDFLSDLVYATT